MKSVFNLAGLCHAKPQLMHWLCVVALFFTLFPLASGILRSKTALVGNTRIQYRIEQIYQQID